MPKKEKIQRNKAIVLKRKRDSKKWSFRKLADFFGRDVKTIHDIWKRDKDKYSLV